MIESMNVWNPWWTQKEVPKSLKGIPRNLDPNIFKALEEKEIIALTGIRRGGKSTIMYQMIDLILKDISPEQVLYLNLDDEVLKNRSLEEIYSTYREERNPDDFAFIFLDEIQNIEGWERFLKKHYDLQDKVKFVISGSSANLLKKEFSTLLTGRNLTFTIYPLSFRSYLKFSGFEEAEKISQSRLLHELHNYLETGGFPEVQFKDKELKQLLLKQYFDDIIYKDIVKRHNINANKITDLAIYLFTNISSLFTIRKLRSYTGLSIDSLRDYISYLQDAFLFHPIDHFSYSLKESSHLPKKSYSIDCGLRNIVGFRFSSDAGRLVENCVRVELLRRGKQVYYWKGKGEVDFIVKEKGLTAINVTYTDDIDKREIESLLEFRKLHRCRMVILTKNLEKEEDDIMFIPLWKWLLD